jgi:hypothetical protein
MRHPSSSPRRWLVAAVVLALMVAGTVAAGRWPYVMTFYDETGNAVGWQIGHCDNSYSFTGQRTDTYTIVPLQCPD